MIYDKEASFPYPILTNKTEHYTDSYFSFEINLFDDDSKNYYFEVTYEIGPRFIRQLLDKKEIKMVLILESEDSKYVQITKTNQKITVPKTKFSLQKRTKFQLLLNASKDISMAECDELNDFYNLLKDEIVIPKGSLIGYSNVETYLGEETKSLILFEYIIEESSAIPFEVKLTNDTIVLIFNSNEYIQVPNNNLLNMYLYVGLSTALESFIRENDSNNEEEIELSSLSQNQSTDLNQKLLDLMNNKNVEYLGYENLDEVINKISDQIIEKFGQSIQEVTTYED